MKRLLSALLVCCALLTVGFAAEAKTPKSGKAHTTATKKAKKKTTAKKIMAIGNGKNPAYLLSNGKVMDNGGLCGEWKKKGDVYIVGWTWWPRKQSYEPCDFSGVIIGDTFYEAYCGSEGLWVIDYDQETQIIIRDRDEDDEERYVHLSECDTVKVRRY